MPNFNHLSDANILNEKNNKFYIIIFYELKEKMKKKSEYLKKKRLFFLRASSSSITDARPLFVVQRKGVDRRNLPSLVFSIFITVISGEKERIRWQLYSVFSLSSLFLDKFYILPLLFVITCSLNFKIFMLCS